MLPENTLAIVARNERWSGWARRSPTSAAGRREAVFFVRRARGGGGGGVHAGQVQISPDGMRWVDEGTSVLLPTAAGGMQFAKVGAFRGVAAAGRRVAGGGAADGDRFVAFEGLRG